MLENIPVKRSAIEMEAGSRKETTIGSLLFDSCGLCQWAAQVHAKNLRRRIASFPLPYRIAWRRMWWSAIVSVFCLLAAADVATSQTNTAIVSGTVTDSGGAAIPTATVTAISTTTGNQTTATTNETGRYTLLNLTPGFYDVRASQKGFSTVLRHNQELLVGTTITLNFELAIASISETVQVTEAAPVIDVEQSLVDRVIETHELDSLPIFNRNFSDLALLSPGAYITNGTTSTPGIQFGAGSPESNAAFVDGESVTPANTGSTIGIAKFAQDWIQEFSVVANQAPAEYGFSSSGIINAVTRSGANQMHGRLYGYFQNAALNATPLFLPAAAPTKPPYDQQRLGGFLGGPIKQDKIFYFAGFEYLNNLTSIPVNIAPAFSAPGATSGVYPQTTKNPLAMAKVDYRINSSDIVHLRANLDRPLSTNTGLSISSPPEHGTNGTADDQVYLATWDHVLSPTELNEFHASFLTTKSTTQANAFKYLGPYPGGGPTYTIPTTTQTPITLGPPYSSYGDPTGWYAQVTYNAPNVTAGGSSLFGGNGEKDWIFDDVFSIDRGNHTLKFGFNTAWRLFYNSGIDEYDDGVYTIASGSVPFNPSTAKLTGSATASGYPTSYLIYWKPGDRMSESVSSPRIGMFAEDSWKVKSNFTLNFGLRYDLDFLPSETQTDPSLHKLENDTTDIGPRVGVSWTPFRDNAHTVIRGGVGLFYDEQTEGIFGTYELHDIEPVVTVDVNYNSATLNPYCTTGVVSCASGVPAAYQSAVQEVLAYALANSTIPNFNPPGGTVTIGPNTYSIPALPSLPPIVQDIAQATKEPVSFQTSIGVSHEFGEAFNVDADFIDVYGFHQYVAHQGNIAPSPPYGTIYNNIGSVNEYDSDGIYRDYSLAVKAGYRDKRSDSVQLAYSLQDAHDNTACPSFTPAASCSTLSANPFDPNTDYGPSLNVPRDNLVVSGAINTIWSIQVAPLVTFSTPLRYTASTTAREPGCPVYYDHCYPTGYSKGSLQGTNIFALAGRVSKTFKIHERYAVKLMFEGFNLSNHADYTGFGAVVGSSSFMKPTAGNPSRQLQAGFQFDF